MINKYKITGFKSASYLHARLQLNPYKKKLKQNKNKYINIFLSWL